MITDGINNYIVIIIYGSLILLSALLLANPLKVNKKANFWFGIFLFLWSTFWLEEIFAITNMEIISNYLLISIKYLQFYTPIVFYFSVVYYTNPDFKLKKIALKYTILSILFLVGLIMQQAYKQVSLIQNLLNFLIVIQALYFTIFSYILIQQHKKKIDLFSSNTSEIDLKWLEYIITALLALSIFIGLYNMLFTSQNLNLFGNIVSILIIFFVAYNTLKQKEIFLLNEKQRNLIIETNEKTTIEKRKIISDIDLKTLKPKLSLLMKNQQPFLDPELSLIKLAELINVTPHQLSYIINEGFNENFFLFVNRYRVEKVKELLMNKNKANLSIMGIAFESGFNSKTSFNTTFKKISSQTPSEFKKSSS
ncbi:MAG: helix-turn-helix domain-containing protein [Lutibacter sp.]|uniref:helix-turn-helix domain-containing protein n=1 Tax=Lutibacter sp. TaxID=1925666 RepID=UPI0019F0862B|nr:helix-turn-helix domain-containing protein [Lutibacter sp.]NOR28828.1 helix-turn-helix domain-containing protein [Lutibacter sp.]